MTQNKEMITQADNLAGPSESERKHGEGDFSTTCNKYVTENIPSRTTFVILSFLFGKIVKRRGYNNAKLIY